MVGWIGKTMMGIPWIQFIGNNWNRNIIARIYTIVYPTIQNKSIYFDSAIINVWVDLLAIAPLRG